MHSLQHFRQMVETHGNNAVARRIKKSPATISRIMNGNYPNPEKIIALVAEAFPQSGTVMCPVLGEISAAVCVRFKGFSRDGTVSRDRNYWQVKETCLTCKEN